MRCQLWSDSTNCFGVSTVDFKQRNTNWVTTIPGTFIIASCNLFFRKSHFQQNFYEIVHGKENDIFIQSKIHNLKNWIGNAMLCCIIDCIAETFSTYRGMSGYLSDKVSWFLSSLSLMSDRKKEFINNSL